MSQYNSGTVAVTNGSAIFTGASTLFSANVTAGDFFTVVGDNVFYTVGSVDSDTQITLSANYAGVSGTGKAYALTRDFTTNLGFPVPNQGDIETALVVKRAIEEIDAELNTAGIGGDGREWIDLKDSPTFISATQFKIAKDKTASYHVNRRIRATDSATIYGGITASSFAAGETTVTVSWDSGAMTAGLSAVALGIASATAPAITGDGIKGGTPLVDTIGEYTSGVGVTIDSVRLKDQRVENLLDPVNSDDAATKNYVDGVMVSSVFWKQPVRVATTANITLSGEQTIDGVLTSADRILVKDQTTGSENGIYVTASGAWSRASDADVDAEVVAGIAVFVAEGTANGDKAFTLTTDDPITVGTTALTFAQFGGGGGVTAVTGSAPITSSGGSTPDIAISSATTGAAGSMSSADKTKLDGVATAANNYSHPNHTGDVTSSGDGAQTIANNAVTLAKMADMATASLLGRDTASTGDPEVLSKATVLSLLNVSDGAEVNPAVVSQADAEAGSATDERIWTAQRVKQAIDALSSGSDNVARDNIMLNAFRIAINGGLSVLNMEDGIVDEFEDQIGVDTVTSTGETYDVAGDFYTNLATVNEGDLTPTASSMTDWGDNLANRKFMGLRFTASVAGSVQTAKIDVKDVTASIATAHAEIWTDSAGSPGVKVGGSSDNLAVSSTGLKTFSWSADKPSLSASTFYWLVLSDDSGGQITPDGDNSDGVVHGLADTITAISEDSNSVAGRTPAFEVSLQTGGDMTLQSAAFSATATPTDARIVVFEEDIVAVTINTDLKAYVSRDGGTSFTQITLADEGDFETGKQILAGSVDISAQPSGSSMKWKLTSHNNAELRIHGVALQWS